jgi:hypothetical protein
MSKKNKKQKISEMKSLLKKAIEKWGLKPQLVILMEESAELIQQASKIIRALGDDKVFDYQLRHFAEEVADVLIMIAQIETAFPQLEEMEKDILDFKINQLKARLEEEEDEK